MVTDADPVTLARSGSARIPRAPARSLRWTRQVFLRLLGLSALCAFVSLHGQLDGLFGSRGIAPASELMQALRAHADAQGWGALRRFVTLPTLAWLSSSDALLHGLAVAGIVASLLLVFDVAPGPMVAVAWITYLSLVEAGGVFFHFQWDALLLETLFVALFLAPWRIRPGPRTDAEPLAAGIWLARLLAFKLMFLSGAVKLLAQDDTWTSLRALDVHFFTQPLPTWTAYWAHWLPHGWHASALVVCLAIELVLPWCVFGPRRARLAFGLGTLFLMAMIAVTGNYGFFNLLTCALAVPCLDDGCLARFAPRRLRAWATGATREPRAPGRWARRIAWVAAVPILLVSALQVFHRLDREAEFGGALLDATAPFASINAYGLFQDMTLRRPEIVVEGSRDGEHWEAYEFAYKPGALDARPRFTGPGMPRLDWQMWFAALQGCARARWFQAFVAKLLAGEPDVRALLAHDPFGDEPPLWIRTTVWDYTFAEPGERGWWRRSDPRPFCPTARRPGTAR